MDDGGHFPAVIPWVINFLHYFIDFNSTGRKFFSYGKKWGVLITARKKCPRKREADTLGKEEEQQGVKSAARRTVTEARRCQEAKHVLELFMSVHSPQMREAEVGSRPVLGQGW